MEDIFHESQLSLAKHKRCCERLAALLAGSTIADFVESLFSSLSCVLTIFKREPAVERVLDFIVRFLTHGHEFDAIADKYEGLVNTVCLRLLCYASVADKAVRFRVTQIVSSTLNSMAEDAEVSDELFKVVDTTMRARSGDRVPVVRALALRALFRLQDPQSPDDPITTQLLWAMAKDPSKEVRMASIATIAPSKQAIRALLERARECSMDVRLHAIVVLRDKTEMRWLSIAQRTELLSGALNERHPKLRARCVELLQSWLRKLGNKPLSLLKGLDVANHELTAVRALRALLDDTASRKLIADAAMAWQTLSAEALLCLRVYIA